MAVPPVTFDTEQLLAEMSWVRTLARQLEPDSHLAEDLTQDTMIVALRGRAPDTTIQKEVTGRTPLRRWLATVVRNLRRTARRREQRRSAREKAVANAELEPATLALIERAATQRRLVGAVLELHEPYRSALLLRFFEGCSYQEIATRTRVPVSTVGSRITEGLQRLRRTCGPRNSWLATLTSLPTLKKSSLPALAPGIAIVKTQTKLILSAVVLVGAWVAFQLSEGDVDAATEPDGQPTAVAPKQAPGIDRDRVPEQAVHPTEKETEEGGFESIPAHAGITFRSVRGRVEDLEGRSVGGVRVQRFRTRGMLSQSQQLVPPQPMGSCVADADGRFETKGAPPFTLSVSDDRYATLFEARVVPDSASEALIVVAPRIPLGGVIVDETGSPIKGVRATVAARPVKRGRDLSTSRLVVPEAISDERGTFRIAGAAAIEDASLRFAAAGFATKIIRVPRDGDPSMSIVMQRVTNSLYTIHGRVVLPGGKPAAGALVSTGVMASKTDERGFFIIELEPWLKFRVDEAAPTILTAIRSGLRPVSRTLPSVKEARERGWPENLVIELGDRPLTIRGSVVDETGKPMAGVLVEPTDMTPFGLVPRPDLPAYGGVPRTHEQLTGGGATRTDGAGKFIVRGLLEREYSISALQRPSLLYSASPPVPAGKQDLKIVLDRRQLGTIGGRIVDRSGAAIPGVRVSVSRKRIEELVIGRSGVTAKDGTFAIEAATLTPAFLRIEGDLIVPELFRELAPGDDITALELQVGRRRRIQIDWGSQSTAKDRLKIIDAQGERLTMVRLSGGGISPRPEIRYRKGVTQVFVVSDAATHAIISRDAQEIRRIRLDLTANDLNVIQL